MLSRIIARAADLVARGATPCASAPPSVPPATFLALAASLAGLIEREARELAHLEAIEERPGVQGRTQGLEWPIHDLRRRLDAAREIEALLRVLAPCEAPVRRLAELETAEAMRSAHATARLVAADRAPDAWPGIGRVPVYLAGELGAPLFHTYSGRLPR